jgi:hypothetical protein
MAELQFTQMVSIKKTRGVYLLWKNGTVVYVGQSENILQRVGVHLANPNKDFDGFSYAVVENGDLNIVEADLIVRYNPPLNNGLPRNKKYVTRGGAKRYFGMNGWELRRTLKNVAPVWRDYYLVSDLAGAK